MWSFDSARGISPTVREGSDTVWNEPSLTVGLVPRMSTTLLPGQQKSALLDTDLGATYSLESVV
jgi:hypothetical protein